jgi:hypothetical protein
MTTHLDIVKPVRFPVTWLTYKARIRRDLDRAYAVQDAEEYFNSDYFNKICAQAKQLEEWLAKLFLIQIALTIFQVVGFISNDASLSLFGITLKQAAGVKEMLLAFSASVAVITWMVILSRDTTMIVIERLIELSTDDRFVLFDKLAAPTPFNIKVYVPRAYEDWIFPTLPNRFTFLVFVVGAILLSLAVFLFSLAVNVVFFLDVYRNPTLGIWSKFVLSYVAFVAFIGVLFLVRFYLPQPYRDQSMLLEMKALEEADPALYRRKLEEVYGEHSKYRKWRLSYLVRATFSRVLSFVGSQRAALLKRMRTLLPKSKRRQSGPWG